MVRPGGFREVCLFNPREAAEILAVHPKTLTRWAREGKIPYIALGGHATDGRVVALRFQASDLEDWIRGRRRPGRTTWS